MPLVYQQNINESTKLAVWHIAEPEYFFTSQVPLYKTVNHPHKRLQHLAGRLLLKELYPDFPLSLILIAESRRPYLEDEQYHFSISHAGDYAAAIVSKQHRVGVDVEVPDRKIENLQHKFLHTEENDRLTHWPVDRLHQLVLAWSFKESMFKWYRSSGIDFKEHLHIYPVADMHDRYAARCEVTKGETAVLAGKAIITERFVLTWVME